MFAYQGTYSMKTTRLVLLLLLAILYANGQYAVHQSGRIVRLEDTKNQMTVTVIPTIGALAIEFTVKGTNILRSKWASVDEFLAKPTSTGIPYRGPWFNRLDEHAFWANGKKYIFNDGLGNIRGAQAMSGFVMLDAESQWKLIEFKADASAAWVTSKLDFYTHPDWMAQWPFAHTVEITYKLQDGVLEVRTKVENLSTDPMPASFGFEPNFRLTDSPRDEWKLGLGARTTWLLNNAKIPTGEVSTVEAIYGTRQGLALKGLSLDNQFADFERDTSGRSWFSIEGKHQKIDFLVGPHWQGMGIYAPDPASNAQALQSGGFVALEPMTALTNGLNLAQRGIYKELQTIPPGKIWQESFWIRPTGF
jgi:aldose 1-epimerase